MAFKQRKKREPLGEAALLEYAVGMLGRQMRTERELRRLMKARAAETVPAAVIIIGKARPYSPAAISTDL